MGCCSSNIISSGETEDVSLVRSAFKSLDESYNENNDNESTNLAEFELKLKKYKPCFCGCIEPKNQLKYYTIWNIFSWFIVCGLILYFAIDRGNTLGNTQYCCQCYWYAQNQTENHEHVKIDFSYCMDTECNCKNCTDDNPPELCPFVSHKWTIKSCGGKDDRRFISITSWNWFRKNYWQYGLSVCLLGGIYIAFMMGSCLFKNLEHVLRFMGISMFVYNLIMSLSAWWSVFKIYQYYKRTFNPEPYLQANGKITCYIDGVNQTEEDILTNLTFITMGVVVVQIMMTILKCIQNCFRCCCPDCCGINVDSAWNVVTRWLEVIILVVTIAATILFFMDLLYVTGAMIVQRFQKMDKDREFKSSLAEIIVADFIILFKSVDIFCVPLFRQELFCPGITLCLDRVCRVKNENNGDIKTYSKMPTSRDNNNNVN